MRVEQFSLGFGPILFKKKKGDTEYNISAIPLGGFVKLAGDTLEERKGKPDEYFSKTIFQRVQIIFAGPFLNFILGLFLFWVVFLGGYPSFTTKVGGLIDGLGAKEAGLKVGDEIVAIDNSKISSWEDLQLTVRSKKAPSRIQVSFLRQKEAYTVAVDIKEKELLDQFGRKKTMGAIGIVPGMEVKHGVISSFTLALKKTEEITVITYKGLWLLFTRQLSVRDSVSGPLGILLLTYQVAGLGLLAIAYFIALLSVSLAIFNLLPIPVLDGGHILFLSLEKIRGRTLSVKSERVITQAGVTLILCMVIFVTYNDFLKHQTEIYGNFSKIWGKVHKFLPQ